MQPRSQPLQCFDTPPFPSVSPGTSATRSLVQRTFCSGCSSPALSLPSPSPSSTHPAVNSLFSSLLESSLELHLTTQWPLRLSPQHRLSPPSQLFRQVLSHSVSLPFSHLGDSGVSQNIFSLCIRVVLAGTLVKMSGRNGQNARFLGLQP